jgi:hypothetical protein
MKVNTSFDASFMLFHNSYKIPLVPLIAQDAMNPRSNYQIMKEHKKGIK